MQEFFTWITSFFSTGIYDLITSATAQLVEWLTIMKLETMLWCIKFGWDVAVKVINNIGLSAAIQAAWGRLDSELLNALMWFRVPDAINMMVNAFGTRFVLRFIPLAGW